MLKNIALFISVCCLPLILGACEEKNMTSEPPVFLTGEISRVAYDGLSNDLLTGGLGVSGIKSAVAPTFKDINKPTEEELRTSAIYTNYRALIDTTSGGGFGRLYGPNVGQKNKEGKIAGTEYLSFMKLSAGHQNVTLMVQIPKDFNQENPCIITAPSSGSRGIYGAIGTTGEWGLKKGCAVAYTDKGTGTGFHYLTSGKTFDLRGNLIDVVTAGQRSSFTVELTPKLKDYNEKYPNRVAVKHAHSGLNDEVNWGKYVLSSVKFAFYALNKELAEGNVKFMPENTLVIASSISQGGNSSIQAAEQDTEGLIDAVTVAEPNLAMARSDAFSIQMGAGEPFQNHSMSLYDYTTLLNLYQPCAVLSDQGLNSPFGAKNNIMAQQILTGHCGLLKSRGLLKSETTQAQVEESVKLIKDLGILDETLALSSLNVTLKLWATLAVDYGNAFGRFSVMDNLCGLSYAKMTSSGKAEVQTIAEMAKAFSVSGGIAPTAGLSFSPTELKFPVDYAICYRDLITKNSANALRVQKGIKETYHSANLRGVPTIIVHGQSDALIHVNHSSRAYLGLNHVVEGDKSNLKYYEVANAHHFDAFNAFAGFNSRFVPLHHYFAQGLDLMYDHMTKGTALPDSQVIWTKTRKIGSDGTVEALNDRHLSRILKTPTKSRIKIEDGIVKIPVE